MSSGLGSFACFGDPVSTFFEINLPAYQASKAALDAITVMYAKELHATPFKVNAICPGYRATDLSGPGVNAQNGASDPAEGADIIVRMSFLGADGPSGVFFSSEGYARPW